MISQRVYQQAIDTFRECDEYFLNEILLRSIFITPKLRPFADRLPTANNLDERIRLTLSYLVESKLADGSMVLPEFVTMLRDQYNSVTLEHTELNNLLQALADHTDVSETALLVQHEVEGDSAFVFVSYSRDDRATVNKVIADLQAAGINVWIDHQNLTPGTPDWEQAIRDGIAQSQAVLYMASPTARSSQYVRGELAVAEIEKRPVLPIWVHGTHWHNCVPLGRGYSQYVDVRGDAYGEGIQETITGIRDTESEAGQRMSQPKATETGMHSVVAFPTKEDHNQTPPPQEQDQRRIPVWMMILGALIIALSVVGIIILTRPTLDDPVVTELAQVSTSTQTQSQTPTATLDIAMVVATLDAEATDVQATTDAQATAAARATGYAQSTQAIIDATATATLWTDTPTPDVTASIQAYRTQIAASATQQAENTQMAATTTQRVIEDAKDATATQHAQATLNSQATSDAQQTEARQAQNTQIAATTTQQAQNMQAAATTTQVWIDSLPQEERLAFIPVTKNDVWVPYERDFDGTTMVLVPVGCFMMGSEDGYSDEQPVHEQCIEEPFWLDKYEVTNAAYGEVGCEEWSAQPEQPRNCVTWHEAQAFCEARGARLPSEVEWEWAARGPESWDYPWGNEFDASRVVFQGNSNDRSAVVGSKPTGASWVGAQDMAGNVWEWTRSGYGDYPYEVSDGREEPNEDFYVLRGGSLNNTSNVLRSPNRFRDFPLSDHFGFRCSRSLESIFRSVTLSPPSTVPLEELAFIPVTKNDDWVPYERDFDGTTMVLVPVGCFMMGSEDGDDDERPVHEQCIEEPFWLDKYEVTNATYGEVGCGNHSSQAEQPRNCVTWHDAWTFCEAQGGRLPSEVEWEWAARGPESWDYPWGDTFDGSRAVYGGNSNDRSVAVGSRPTGASWVGAQDIAGNVREWTRSIFREYPYNVSDGREEIGEDSYVLRGGSFFSSPYGLRSAYRLRFGPLDGSIVGFRCSRSF